MKYLPEIVHIDVTGKCNLRCKHCRNNMRNFRKEYSFNVLKKRLAELINECRTIKWVKISGGEPLLYENLFELIAFLHQNNIRTILQTNGVLLNNDNVKKLKQVGLTKVQISFEGATAQTHEFIRGKGTFNKVVEATRLLVKSKIPFAIRVTITKYNIREIENMVRLAKRLKACEIGFRRVIPVGRAASKKLDISNMEYAEFLNSLSTLERKYSFPIFCGDPIANSLGLNKNFLIEKEGLELGGCTICVNSLCITSDGFVTPCSMINLRLADLLKSKIMDVWKSNYFFKKMREKNIKKCKNCSHKDICGGCRAVAFAHYKNYFAHDPNCLMRNKIKLNHGELLINLKMITQGLSNSYLFKDDLHLQVDAGHVFREKVDILVLTHCHYDHIAYVNKIKERNPHCKIMCGEKDAKAIETLNECVMKEKSNFVLTPVKIDKRLKMGDKINLGHLTFIVLETPGHTRGSISLYEKNEKILLTGDTWFGGLGHGRNTFPSGSKKDMNISLKMLKKLKTKIILPGHYSVIV